MGGYLTVPIRDILTTCAGESGPVQISAGLGSVLTDFNARGLPFDKSDEYASINYYENTLKAGDAARIRAQMTASK
jgi:hypothetical protein